ncbi:hypothetical protein Tco_1233265, partial [Tanacetum coccineum]
GEGSKNSLKKSHRRSYNRAKDVARHIDSIYNATDGVKFTGHLSDLYKVSHEEVVGIETGIENRRTRNEDGVYNVCSISENQLKEVGEQIGVTWDEVAGPRKGEILARKYI